MRSLWILPLIFVVAVEGVVAHQSVAAFIVEIKADGVLERSRIAEVIHIDSVVADRVFSVVNYTDLLALSELESIQIISVEAIEGKTIGSDYTSLVGEIDFPDRDELFHTYDETLDVLKELEAQHSGVAQVFSIGKSIEDRDIWGIRISDDSSEDQDKKAIVYMGTHHAREHVSTELAIAFAKELLDSSIVETDIQSLLKRVEIFIIPIVNPDGAIHDIEGKRYKWWRKNRRLNDDGSFGVDLNRNYDHGWGTGGSSSNPSSDVYMGLAPFSEPETQAIREFFLAHENVTMALSLHTFSELILYPWGGKDEGVGGQDEAIFKKMASDIADFNDYTPMQSSELYIASGDTCDWLYGELSIYCLTFELSPSSIFSGGFYPGASMIEKVFQDNWEPMLYLANLAENPKSIILSP